MTHNCEDEEHDSKLIKIEFQTSDGLKANEKNAKSTNSSFSWINYLKSTKSKAAPVSAFRHAPLNQMWSSFGAGMKLEVINTDCDDFSTTNKEKVFWFVSVVRIEGYLALVRYEGYDDDGSMDFWCHLCDPDVHSVGWCGQFDVKLVPPRTIEHRQKDWKTFLVNRLVGSKTLPDNFRNRLQTSFRSPFKKNLLVEVIDKHRVSRMKIGRISSLIGDRLRIIYDNTVDENFTVHFTSDLIHPVGWSRRVGHEIELSDERKSEIEKIFQNNFYPPDVAEPSLFFTSPDSSQVERETFKTGQKLEAVDPLEMSRICPATVAKVLDDGFFMLSIDGTGVDDESDWFCLHSTSRLIFPINFCKLNGIELSPPPEFSNDFTWENYLRQTNSVYAPHELFQVVKENVSNPFSVGMKLEAVDLIAPELICVATIGQIAKNLVRIHFDGWTNDFDQWIDCQSANIYPVGWCQFVGHDLESPKEKTNETCLKTEKPNKIQRSKKFNSRKSNKRKRI